MSRYVVWWTLTGVSGGFNASVVDLMMATVCSSESPVSIYHTTLRNITENGVLHTHRHENLKDQPGWLVPGFDFVRVAIESWSTRSLILN
jgi:hypothetical protein